jgi:hypothetical protein
MKDGTYAIRCVEATDVDLPYQGDTVLVDQKDGSQKEVILGEDFWTGQDKDGNAVGLYRIPKRGPR